MIHHGAKRDILIAYDISDPSRLRKVHKIVKGHGEAVQYSVYRCFLTPARKIKLMRKLLDHINSHEDQVLFFELGSAQTATSRPIEVVGRAMAKLEVGPKVL